MKTYQGSKVGDYTAWFNPHTLDGSIACRGFITHLNPDRKVATIRTLDGKIRRINFYHQATITRCPVSAKRA